MTSKNKKVKLTLTRYQVEAIETAATVLSTEDPSERRRQAWHAVLRESRRAIAYDDGRRLTSPTDD